MTYVWIHNWTIKDRIKESGNEENDRKLYIKVEVALGSVVSCLENSTWEAEAGSLYEPAFIESKFQDRFRS